MGFVPGGVSSTYPLSKIDGRGSQVLLRARDVIVTIQVESLEGFVPPYVSHLIPYHATAMCASFLFVKCYSLTGFVLALPFAQNALCLQFFTQLGSLHHVGFKEPSLATL